MRKEPKEITTVLEMSITAPPDEPVRGAPEPPHDGTPVVFEVVEGFGHAPDPADAP